MNCKHEWKEVKMNYGDYTMDGHKCKICGKYSDCHATYTHFSDGSWNKNCKVCGRFMGSGQN